jgi:exopolysaccharide biosynthesis predicted pyruvyltransferase EpsI
MLRELWLYFKPFDICQLIQIDKTAANWCVQINTVVSQEFHLNVIEKVSDERKCITFKVVSLFPKLSKLIFSNGFHNHSLHILLRTESVRESIEELRVRICQDYETYNIKKLKKKYIILLEKKILKVNCLRKCY